MACVICRAKERKEIEKMMLDAHKERRIKTVNSLKRDIEVIEVWLFLCVICSYTLDTEYLFLWCIRCLIIYAVFTM